MDTQQLFFKAFQLYLGIIKLENILIRQIDQERVDTYINKTENV